ncbi:hypothetical protein [Allomesorhizobium camelthorni]|uniref:hypothetical protein n=1 Tax=Allomesorhizobium camelthorni TaxID=475069 RepID=UPI001FE27187|nr:hypothetical protein [Mesorhizobium camelthorni]
MLESGQHFHSWDHEKTPKKKGGKVFITVSHRGEVECHKGWLSRKEARRARAKDEGEKADTPAKPSRPELAELCRICIAMPPCARPCSTTGRRAAPDGGACHHRFRPVAGAPRPAARRQ